MELIRFHIFERTQVSFKQSDVETAMRGITNKMVGKELHRSDINSLIRGTLKKFKIKTEVQTSPAVSHNMVSVSGWYDEDENTTGMVIVFNPDDQTIILSKNYWNWLVTEVADAVYHEHVHKGQARKRDYIGGQEYFKSVSNDQKYYGRPDEIEAFASNAASELMRANNNNVAQARKVLTNFTKCVTMSGIVKRYAEAFGSPDHPVMKKFFKKVYSFME